MIEEYSVDNILDKIKCIKKSLLPLVRNGDLKGGEEWLRIKDEYFKRRDELSILNKKLDQRIVSEADNKELDQKIINEATN